jgi:F0F1-type ATP synthase assembly protein I
MPKSSNTYLRYSGMAFQMLALILLGVWSGGKLDAWLQNSRPYFTAALALLGVFIGFYQLYKEVSR